MENKTNAAQKNVIVLWKTELCHKWESALNALQMEANVTQKTHLVVVEFVIQEFACLKKTFSTKCMEI